MAGKTLVRGGENRTAAGEVGLDKSRQQLGALRIERVQRLIEKPQRGARRRDARERRPLQLARRQEAHRHLLELPQSKCRYRVGWRSNPEFKGAAKRQLTIERNVVVRECGSRPFNMSRF